MSDWTKIPQEVLDVLNRQLYLISAKSLTCYFLKPGDTGLTKATKKDPLPANYGGFKIYWQNAGELGSYYVYQDPDGEFVDIYFGYEPTLNISGCTNHTCIRQCWRTPHVLRILLKHQCQVVNLMTDFSLNKLYIESKYQSVDATEAECLKNSGRTLTHVIAWGAQDLRWGSVTIWGSGVNHSLDPALKKQYTSTMHPDTINIVKALKIASAYARTIATMSWNLSDTSLNNVLEIITTEPYRIGNQKKYGSSEYDGLRKLAADPRENIIERNGTCVDIKDSGVVFHHLNLASADDWCSGLLQGTTLQFLPYKDNFRFHNTNFQLLKQELKAAAPTEELKNIIESLDAGNSMFTPLHKACKQTTNTKYDDITQKYSNKYATQELNTYGKQKIKVEDLINHQLYKSGTPIQREIMHKVLLTLERPVPITFINNLEYILGGHDLALPNWLYLSKDLKMCAYVCVLALSQTDWTRYSVNSWYRRNHNLEPLDALTMVFNHFYLDMSNPVNYANSLIVLARYVKNSDELEELSEALSIIDTKPEVVNGLGRLVGFTTIETLTKDKYILTGIADENHDNWKLWSNTSFVMSDETINLSTIKSKLEGACFYLNEKPTTTVTQQNNIFNINMDCKNRATYYGVLRKMLSMLQSDRYDLI
jgi:hypothetical protein